MFSIACWHLYMHMTTVAVVVWRLCCCSVVVAPVTSSTIKLPSNLRQSCEAFLSHARQFDVVRMEANSSSTNDNNNKRSSITILGSIDSSDIRWTPGALRRHTIICFIYAISADSVCLLACGSVRLCVYIFYCGVLLLMY